MSYANAATPPVVSFDDEPLILVDSQDNIVGFGPKTQVHAGQGVLHRAFSIFLFDSQGRTLLQRRAADKPLWGDYWSNSCCSHPRRGETVDAAALRRLREELGIDTALTYLYRFEYQARFGEAGSEHELCSVYAACSDAPAQINSNEISESRYIAPAALDAELQDHPERYTPWLKMEWPRIRAAHWEQVAALRGE